LTGILEDVQGAQPSAGFKGSALSLSCPRTISTILQTLARDIGSSSVIKNRRTSLSGGFFLIGPFRHPAVSFFH
jgi:hypothetical protein